MHNMLTGVLKYSLVTNYNNIMLVSCKHTIILIIILVARRVSFKF